MAKVPEKYFPTVKVIRKKTGVVETYKGLGTKHKTWTELKPIARERIPEEQLSEATRAIEVWKKAGYSEKQIKESVERYYPSIKVEITRTVERVPITPAQEVKAETVQMTKEPPKPKATQSAALRAHNWLVRLEKKYVTPVAHEFERRFEARREVGAGYALAKIGKGAFETMIYAPTTIGKVVTGIAAVPPTPERVLQAVPAGVLLAARGVKARPFEALGGLGAAVIVFHGVGRTIAKAKAVAKPPKVFKAAYTKAVAERVPAQGFAIGKAKGVVFVQAGKKVFVVKAKTAFAAQRVTKTVTAGVAKSKLVAKQIKGGLKRPLKVSPKTVEATLKTAGYTFEKMPAKGFDITAAYGRLYMDGKPIQQMAGAYLTKRGVLEIRLLKHPLRPIYERVYTRGFEAPRMLRPFGKPVAKVKGVTDIVTFELPVKKMQIITPKPPKFPPMARPPPIFPKVPKGLRPVEVGRGVFALQKVKPIIKPMAKPPTIAPPKMFIERAAVKMVAEITKPKAPKVAPMAAAIVKMDLPKAPRPMRVRVAPPRFEVGTMIKAMPKVTLAPVLIQFPKMRPMVTEFRAVAEKVTPIERLAPAIGLQPLTREIPIITPKFAITPALKPITRITPALKIKFPTMPKITPPTFAPTPPIMPPPLMPIFPDFGVKAFKAPKVEITFKMPKVGRAYMPSLTAQFVKPIFHAPKGILTGLEIRPFVTPRKKRKKRR